MSNLATAITYLGGLMEKVLGEVFSEGDFADLTTQQFHYLRIIMRMDKPTLSELARELDLTKPTVTVLVDKLAEKGYVKRVKSDHDRRSMHLHLDEKGWRIYHLQEKASARLAEIVSSGLNATEIVILSELLKKVINIRQPEAVFV